MVLQSPLTASALVVSLGLLVHLLLQREKTPLHWNLVGVLAALIVWTGGALLRLGATTPGVNELAYRTVWLGFQTAVPLWLLLALRYARFDLVERRPYATLAGILTPTAVTYAIVLTNEHHHWFHTTPLPLGHSGGGPRVWAGPMFWAFLGWAYTCVIGAMALYLRASWRLVANQDRGRGVVLALAAGAPLVIGTSHVLGIVPFQHDPTPAALAFSLGGLMAAVFRFQLLDALPLARRDVIEHLHDGVLLADDDGFVLDANPAAERILGASARALRGQPLALALADLERQAEPVGAGPDPRGALAADGATVLRLRMRDERRIEVWVAAVAGGDGEPAGSYVLLRDRTDEHRTEAALRQSQKLETVGALVAGLAHEVNNPLAYVRANLTQIQGLAALVKQRLERFDRADQMELEELPDLVDETLGGIDRIARVVDRMRRFSRIPSDAFVAVDLNAVARESVKLAALHANKTVSVVLRLDPRLPAVAGSPERLGQVLLNLLVNAKHALAGSATGRILVESRARGEDVEVRVTDNGPGVPHAIQERIFDPFFTTKGPDEGTGLGLAIAFDIVREHGGSIELVSRPAEGACFIVRLPRAAEGAEEA